METYASPFVKVAIGIAIITVSLAVLMLAVTPLVNAIRWW